MNPSPIPVPLERVQGIILRGYEKLEGAFFVLLSIIDAERARGWLAGLVPEVRTAEEKPSDRAVNVAFTFPGLTALGLHVEVKENFSREFTEGMDADHRNRALGDIDSVQHRVQWDWGDRYAAPHEHLLLMLYAATREAALALYVEHQGRFAAGGLEELRRFEPRSLPDRKEQFGFRDGISQPGVKGVFKPDPTTGNSVPPPPSPTNDVDTGEILLGYLNAYTKIPPSPTVPKDCAKSYDFGKDGSYLVVRQLEQRVRSFWNFVRKCVPAEIQGAERDVAAVRLASKMVGRWPNGAPMANSETGDDPTRRDDNDFAYGQDDPLGLKTPIGSHIRRTHPRDSIEPGPGGQERISPEASLEVSKLHRIVRRGRPYGDPLSSSLDPVEMMNAPEDQDTGRGLFFACFNANIARQFEFIQQTWANSPKFGGLYDDADPIMGQRNPVGSERPADVFTEQANPIRKRYEGLPQFVRVRGGGYFFMPGIESLKYLAGLPFNLDTVTPVVPVDKAYPQWETVPPDEEEYARKLTDMLRQKVERDYPTGTVGRDAHAKHHGLVRAEFTVEKGLPKDLAVGVFKEPRTYPAFIRFSNQEGKPRDDIDKDIRGMAIKLLDVDGQKILEGECTERTHDFLLISTPVFVTRDVREFHDLIAALIRGNLSLLWYFLNPFNSHLRVMRNLWKSTIRHANPLEVRYFSTTPYRLGGGAVKYSARPVGEPKSAIPSDPTKNFLREAMAKTLQEREATFDFLVQLATDRESCPIEDPGQSWDEKKSPYRKVATVRIFRERFDAPARDTLAENISYTPWHALPDHQPLGGINRARKIAYEIISKFRHEKNGVPRREPTVEEWRAMNDG